MWYTPIPRLCVGLVLALLLAACQGREMQPPVPSTTALQPAAGATSIEMLPTSDPYQDERERLVAEVQAMGVQDEQVLSALATVPRHAFVLPDYLEQAYANHPLPIGYGQTISQPFIVAWMTELLELQPGDKVLEIGTGSGYQAAVLAELGGLDIYTIEIVPELAQAAATRLADLGYTQIHTMQGDGYYGWPDAAPFDAILVTAAPDHLPAPLAAQLSPKGRLVIPIGPQGWVQSLWTFEMVEGELTGYNHGGVSFVPFTGPGIQAHPAETTSVP